MPGRIHVSPLKGANAEGSYGWLLDPKGGESGKPSAADSLAVARHTLNRDRRRHLPLLERQDPHGSPIDAAVSDIVAMVRAGRMSIDDLRATQSQETSRLRALKVMHGHNRDIERLAASTDVRARALDQIHRDPFIAVVAPQPATVAEANDCHNPAGSPDGGQFCSAPGTGKGARGWRRLVGLVQQSDASTRSEAESVVVKELTDGFRNKAEAEDWLGIFETRKGPVYFSPSGMAATGPMMRRAVELRWPSSSENPSSAKSSWRDEPHYVERRPPLKGVQVRPKVRGDVSGYSVIGPGRMGSISIFVRKHETAKAIQSALKRGASHREIDDLIMGERTKK